MAANLARAKRRTVIWLSFQECTGCLATLLRSFSGLMWPNLPKGIVLLLSGLTLAALIGLLVR